MLSRRNRLLFWAALLLLGGLAGCGDGSPPVVKVTGTLNYLGKPVTNAHLTFLPDFGRQSWAQTDAQGKFKINYDKHQDGAVVGKHKVWVEYKPISHAEQEAYMMGKPPPISKEMKTFFEKYGQANSTLEVQIERNTRELNLNLD